jgi:uncharacterized DUF497 family protein
MKLKFEWDAAKAEANWKKHGVSFEMAQEVFRDPLAVLRIDERADYGEERFVITGVAANKLLLAVAYTEREENIRLISARRATQHEQDDYLLENR